MSETIIDNILNPKYRNGHKLSNIDDKIEMCEELKRLEAEIMQQLDREHKKMFRQYAEYWDKLHAELCLDAFTNGSNMR
ncbi:MAG: hypothetical protein IJ643_01295 [Eubacterium sp.]|nr:hypothetical protein [Eubacterium sp.]